MNLIRDPWLPCLMQDSSIQVLRLAEMVRPDVIDLALPRSDFQAAAYQFLIGLLQTVMAPENNSEWHQRYNNLPTIVELQSFLDKVAHAFSLIGEGPLFMQDFDDLEDCKSSDINGLFIDGPGENGLKNNTDHFVKRDTNTAISLPMAAMALITWQINGVAFGSGYRVGLRGAGPLTSLVVSNDPNTSLWQNLWLNVINREYWVYDDPDLASSSVFPWLGPTKCSNVPNSEIYADEAHPLVMYWATATRLRLEVQQCESVCAVSGKAVKKIVKSFKRQNYGNNYAGTWFHPFNAYRFNLKKPEEIPNPVKPQSDGITYRIWDVLSFTDKSNGHIRAKVIDHYYDVTKRIRSKFSAVPRLWCFGYNMKNREALCWYSRELPIINHDYEKQEDFLLAIKELQILANKFRLEINNRIKEAWFDRPGDAKGDTSFIAAEFWQRTENIFFEAVQALSKQEYYYPLATVSADQWLNAMQKVIQNLFDEYTLTVDVGDPKQIKRIMQARRFLNIWIYSSNDIKKFKQHHGILTKQKVV